VVRRRTCLDAHQARRKSRKEPRNLSALKLSAYDDPTTGVDAVDLEHALCNIKTNRGNLQVRLIPPAYVEPYVRRSKTDAANAAASCEAVGRPSWFGSERC
jgi:transposase